MHFAPTLTTSQQVAETAAQFIALFEQPLEKHNLSSTWEPLLSLKEKASLLGAHAIYNSNLTEHIADKRDRDNLLENSGFFKIGQGHHFEVWSHHEFRHLVFKKMSLKDAKKQYEVAQRIHEFASQKKGFLCRVPVADFIELPTKNCRNETEALYVEEKLPLGLGMDGHQEFWSRIFAHFSSDNCASIFKDNLFVIINDVVSIVETQGFWDTGLHNLPEVSLDGSYVSVTDFENISKVGLSAEGFQRLAEVFSHETYIPYFREKYCTTVVKQDFIDELKMVENTKKICGRERIPKSEQQLIQSFKRKIADSLALNQARQEAIKFYDKKGWTHEGDPFPSLNFDPVGMNGSQKTTARALLSKMRRQARDNCNDALSSKRCLSLHKLYSEFTIGPDDMVDLLNNLKKQELVVSWVQNTSDKSFFWF